MYARTVTSLLSSVAVPLALLGSLCVHLAACAVLRDKGAARPDQLRKVAMATLEPKSGSDVRGTVTFLEEEDGDVRVIASLHGLSPGAHGFHVHEEGDCSAPDASSAGPHFAGVPTRQEPKLGTAHGDPRDRARHVGDLGNIVAGPDGTARLEREDDVIALDGERSIIGRAMVVHAGRDDGATVQSAGERIACGVIVENGH